MIVALSRRITLLVLTLGLGLGVGCGGNDGTSSSPSPSRYPAIVPPARFIRQAKEICEAAKQEMGDEVSAFYERRAKETGESNGRVGAVEAIPEVVVPTLRKQLEQLEAIGLPKGEAYEAEAVWQTFKTVLHEVEAEGIYAWRSAKLLPPFRNRAKQFELDDCIVN